MRQYQDASRQEQADDMEAAHGTRTEDELCTKWGVSKEHSTSAGGTLRKVGDIAWSGRGCFGWMAV